MRTSILRPAGLIMLACLAFSACSGPADDAPTPTAGPPTEQGRELTSLVEKARGLTYHATYRIAGEPTEFSISAEVWRKGARVRLDLEQVTADQTVRTSEFGLEGRRVGCSREGDDKPWRCTAIDQAQLSPDERTADPLVGALARELSVAELEVGTEEIAGHQVRCYKTADSTRELCVTADEGIAARLGTAESRLELAELDREVDDSVFEPPAEPTMAGSSPPAD